ncbi:hydroxyisourate hydrolase [[Phormidium ambiguum] IAM M-71]|uniref:5-hydroxyisourate hydrolase n=1 Tax=[Phormidium ambiguum] IAM M-71 TaxID=454136 RepID=A0A1U7IKS7_9CYAN|nr:hydroxyisourate hydrolase [Phormidium ambiguum]OKH37841.1 hydroxyisourate hydrolase [Phormidium ambiguum IAM M-71]
MAGKLTTHILDTARGCPASGIKIELWLVEEQAGEKTLLKTAIANSDGRTDSPLLADREFQPGIYELVFHVGSYFAQHIDNLPHPAFFDRIPIRFGIANSEAHYHVPLLVSPWSYSTYRGS